MKNKILITGSIVILLLFSEIIIINNINDQKVVKDNVTIEDSSKEYAISNFITDEIKSNSTTTPIGALVSYSTEPESIRNIADNIVIMRIISLDGATMEYDGMVGMSYGTMLINDVIKGGIKKGSVVGYIKPGGTISMEEWESYQTEESNQKRARLRTENNKNINLVNTYINTLVEDDIEAEPGKTYLAYLKYNTALNKYEIIGLGNGMRELKINKATESVSAMALNINNQQIKNNRTGEYENLNDYIQKYINVG